jgi:hypothetical protein
MRFYLKILIVLSAFFLSEKLPAQNFGFGAGVILGDPTGLSFKYWTNPKNAWDAGIAWGIGEKNALSLHGDYLWHNFRLIPVDKGRLAVYYGPGTRIILGDDPHFGIRGVIGLDYMFLHVPVDIFLELAPVFDLAPATKLYFNGGLGARYFF